MNSALIGSHLKGARNQPTMQDSQSIKIQKKKTGVIQLCIGKTIVGDVDIVVLGTQMLAKVQKR